MNCESLSPIINVGTPLVAKNFFNTQTHDSEEQSVTKSRYIHLVESQVNKTTQHLSVCDLT